MWSRVTPSLDKPAISKLDHLISIDEIQINTDLRCEIHKRFHGPGTIKLEAKIILDDKVIPYAQSVL